MNSETLELLKTLAEKLGVALSDLLKIYSQRCLANGLYELALGIALIAVFTWEAYTINPLFTAFKALPRYRHNEEMLDIAQLATWALSVIFVLLPALLILGYAVSNLFAPQACAIQAILEAVKK
jgi:hypothetical protein